MRSIAAAWCPPRMLGWQEHVEAADLHPFVAPAYAGMEARRTRARNAGDRRGVARRYWIGDAGRADVWRIEP